MKKIFLLSLFMILSVSTAFSQLIEKPEEELEDKITLAKNGAFMGQLGQNLQGLRSKTGEAAVIKQIGDHNNAVITLKSGDNLFAYILQNGSMLEANLTINGDNNSAIIKQKGYNLATNVILRGHSNNFKLLQHGRGLKNNIKLLNVTGMDVLFLQTKNKFYYSQNGGTGINLKLQSTQRIPTIIIRNSGVN